MAATSGPYGLRPVQKLGSLPFAGGIRQYGLSANSATGFFTGDLVQVAAGVPLVCTATPTTTWTTLKNPTGIFMGCEYVNSSNQKVYAPYLPANAITGGATGVVIYLLEDPFAVFQVQGAGSIPTTAIGKNVALYNFGSGSTITGLSSIQITSAVGTTSTLAMRIVDVPILLGVSAPGDAYTDVYCVFNFGVHGYLNSALA
jgi:hypothetical protein